MTTDDSETIRQTDFETDTELDSHTTNEHGQDFAATGTLTLTGTHGDLTFTFLCEATTEDTSQYADPYLTTDAIHYHAFPEGREEYDSWSGEKDLPRSQYDTPDKLLTEIEEMMSDLARDGSLYAEQVEIEAKHSSST